MKFYILLLPAFVLGMLLWSNKQFHFVKPLYAVPFLLIVPVACFYLILVAAGSSVADARANGWFFEEFGTGPWRLEESGCPLECPGNAFGDLVGTTGTRVRRLRCTSLQ